MIRESKRREKMMKRGTHKLQKYSIYRIAIAIDIAIAIRRKQKLVNYFNQDPD